MNYAAVCSKRHVFFFLNDLLVFIDGSYSIQNFNHIVDQTTTTKKIITEKDLSTV